MSRQTRLAEAAKKFPKLPPLPSREVELIEAIAILRMHALPTVSSHLKQRLRNLMANRLAKKHNISFAQMRKIMREQDAKET